MGLAKSPGTRDTRLNTGTSGHPILTCSTYEYMGESSSPIFIRHFQHFKEGKLTVKAKLGVLATLVDG